MTGEILIGDVLERLRELPADHYDCVIMSPPYWGLRDYGAEGQIGLEPTLAEHIEVMVRVMAEVWRVLKPTGTVWLNYGDCYATQPAGNKGITTDARWSPPKATNLVYGGNKPFSTIQGKMKPKDLCMIPNRLAIALQEWGWWVRSEIIWAKPNPMPESVTDRPATAHEKIWLLTKSARYFYDKEAVRIPVSISEKDRIRAKVTGRGNTLASQAPIGGAQRNNSGGYPSDINGRNLRNYEPAPVQVWNMATRPFPGAHFATFPPELVERCLMAGTSQRGCCAACGAPWVRDVSKAEGGTIGGDWGNSMGGATAGNLKQSGEKKWNDYKAPQSLGWSPSCACNAATVPARVLDPFGGAGTVGLVADAMGLDWTLIEINPEYAAMAEARIRARVAGKGRAERCEGTADLFA